MKIRTGFVSNSSSSSFICSVSNIEGKPLDERVNLGWVNDCLKDAIKYDDEDEVMYYQEIINKWKKVAEEENVCIFDVRVEWGTEDVIHGLVGTIPTFKILEIGE